MMVERAPYTGLLGVGSLMKNLENATDKLAAINKVPEAVSRQELNELVNVLNRFNTTTSPRFWEDKKLAPEGMHAKIEKALVEVQHFQRRHPEASAMGKRNVDQAIISLSSVKDALKAFDKKLRELRDLKKYRIGHKVEKSEESKHS